MFLKYITLQSDHHVQVIINNHGNWGGRDLNVYLKNLVRPALALKAQLLSLVAVIINNIIRLFFSRY